MAVIEQTIARELIELRLAMSTGTEYVKAVDLERALQRHLDCEQRNRAVIAETAAVVGFQARTDVRGLS